MANVIASITMSLDGFIAGVNDNPEQGLGETGGHLHDWILEGDHQSKHNDFFKLSKKNRKIFDELFESTGALITGRRTYDIVHGWEGSYPVSGIPVFVITHNSPSEVPEGKTSFTFVEDGIQRVVQQAKEAAGTKNVQIIGGAQTIQQAIANGLCDELRIHMIPQLLGNGIKLLDHLNVETTVLEKTKVIDTPEVTHLHFKTDLSSNTHS